MIIALDISSKDKTRGEDNIYVGEALKRVKRKPKSSHPSHPPQPTIYISHVV